MEKTKPEPEPRNIFEQILYGLNVTNENIVAIWDELAVVREDLAHVRNGMLPSLTSASAEASITPADKPKKK